MRARTNRPPGILRRIAVVGEHADRIADGGKPVAERLQLRELILGEGLRGKQVESAARWILQDGMQDRRVIAQRLAGSGRRYDDHILSGERAVDRFGLMGIEPGNAARFERLP